MGYSLLLFESWQLQCVNSGTKCRNYKIKKFLWRAQEHAFWCTSIYTLLSGRCGYHGWTGRHYISFRPHIVLQEDAGGRLRWRRYCSISASLRSAAFSFGAVAWVEPAVGCPLRKQCLLVVSRSGIGSNTTGFNSQQGMRGRHEVRGRIRGWDFR